MTRRPGGLAILEALICVIAFMGTFSCTSDTCGFPQYEIMLSGQVADEASRAPVANASLAISCLGHAEFLEFWNSDASGFFEIGYGFEWDVRHVDVLLRVRAEGYSGITLSNRLYPVNNLVAKTDYFILLTRHVVP